VSDNEGSSHLDTRTTPFSKGKKRKYALMEDEENPTRGSKNEKERRYRDSASASWLGATQILEAMTKPLSITALSPLESNMTSLLSIMKDKKNNDEKALLKQRLSKNSCLRMFLK
jgi:hypothetical protein